MKQWVQNQKVRIWVPPVAGFLFYGSWAFFVNYSHGLESAIKAGFTQGSYSFTVTLVLALSVEWLFSHLENVPLRSFWVFLAAFLLLVFTSTGVNIVTGTPNILWTVLPGLLVSTVYTLIYIVTLNKLHLD